MLPLLIVTLLWAASFGLIKTHLVALPPDLVNAVRLLLTLAVFLPFLRAPRPESGPRRALLLLGAVQFGAMYAFYTRSFGKLDAHQAALATILTPLFVTLVDDLLDRRFRLRPVACALLAVLGTALSLGVLDLRGRSLEAAALEGILLIQASNLCFAIGQVGYRRVLARHPELGDVRAFAWCALGGALVGVLAALPVLATQGLPPVSPVQGGVLVYLGVVASGAGFFLWNVGARRVPGSVLAVMNNLKIPAAMLAAFLVFGERPAWGRLSLGLAAILLALLLAARPGLPKEGSRRGVALT